MAFEILDGFGDGKRGEWTEDRPLAFHLRRRLSAEEQSQIGEACDFRGTPEAVERFEAIKHVLPALSLQLAAQELAEASA